MNKKYFRMDVMLEPLINKWYAWPHLVSPSTYSMNVKNHHIPLMESFVESPELHASAVRNPAMAGGPFVDMRQLDTELARTYLDKTKKQCQEQIQFAQAVQELTNLLKLKADGSSLEALYSEMPELLKGYTEIFYDLNNNPGFRFIEPLIYDTSLYNECLQEIVLAPISQDERPFVLSTPRLLTSQQEVRLTIPFSTPALDALFVAREEPTNPEKFIELLGIPNDSRETFLSFFTETPPNGTQPLPAGEARIRYFGHACLLIELGSEVILVDPVISYQYYNAIERYSFPDLPKKIDYVLITHNHQDHILFETLLQIRHKIGTIVVPKNSGGTLQDPSLKLMFEAVGFSNILELDEFGRIALENGEIVGLPFLGEHADLSIRSKLAFHVKSCGKSILLAADSCNLEPKLYERIRNRIGPVDTLFLGMECDGAPLTWLYGPLLTSPITRSNDRSRRLAGSNYEQGKSMVDILGARQVYVYAMGQEPWLNYVMSLKYTEESNPIKASNALLHYCNQLGIHAERLFIKREIEL